MKRILLLVLAFTAAIGSLSAQNYIVVNSEKVFKSIDEYNKALDTLDQLAKSYQQQVDLKFEEVEALYNNYKAQEMSLSASSRQARQNLILTREEEASKFQEEIFGQDGTLMKKRIELIQPIQMLMEAVYTGDGNYALKAAPQIVAALNDEGVRLVEYSPETREYFDLFPGTEPDLTIRPAVMQGERVLARGQATEEM